MIDAASRTGSARWRPGVHVDRRLELLGGNLTPPAWLLGSLLFVIGIAAIIGVGAATVSGQPERGLASLPRSSPVSAAGHLNYTFAITRNTDATSERWRYDRATSARALP